MRAKMLIFLLVFILSAWLIGCSNKSVSKNQDDGTLKNTGTTNEPSTNTVKEQNTKVNSSTPPVKAVVKEDDKNNVSQKITKVNSKVKLYEGTYFDSRRVGEYILKNYCEVVISNVTNTSFDFTVYEINELDRKIESKKVIFLTNTAVFTGDGTKATFYGENYTLNFTFPDYHKAYPAVTDMEISGFKPLECDTYVNNGIPGHEFQ